MSPKYAKRKQRWAGWLKYAFSGQNIWVVCIVFQMSPLSFEARGNVKEIEREGNSKIFILLPEIRERIF